ncbi:cytochrome P450 [Micromonospora echinaurantiaca]|uniref:cytochrome P450 n=1 Tax=Micromonospora echinaurantiaca TaxID=47857 RepID=UPI00371BC1DD
MPGGERVAELVTFDRSDPAFLHDPYPTWTRLRDADPLHLTPGGTYLVTRYEDVTALLRDRRCGRSVPPRLVRRVAGTGPTLTSFLASVLNLEGERHGRIRRLMLTPFTPRPVAGQRERVGALVDGLLDRAGDRFDLIEAVAADLPILLVSDVLGLPHADAAELKRGIAALIDASAVFPPPEALARSDEANAFFADYFARMVRRPAADGLLAGMAAAWRAGRITAEELSANATLLLFAGNETTTNSIGNGVLALLSRPELLDRLRRTPELVPTVVDELLRYDSPVQTTIRWTEAPIDLPSGRLPARRFVEVSLAAANRDPRAFDRADEVVPDRQPNPHLAFGHGMHLCLGLHLARLAGELVLRRLLTRYATVELDGEPVRAASLWNRGLHRLPLRVS